MRTVWITALTAAWVLAATIVLAGCSPRPVRTVNLDGERWIVYEGRQDGMRGLPGFGDADGMLFDMGKEVDPSGAAFGMEEVDFPIDIAWFDGSGALVSTTSMAPCTTAPCPLYHADRPYRWAVEAPPGAFAELSALARLDVGD